VSDLVISTTDLLGSPQHARVVVSLVDADQRPITYGTVSGDPVAAVVRKATDRDGLLTLDLTPNGDISPENTYYLVQVGSGSWLIEKGEDSETVADALAADPEPLAPAALAAHIDNPTAAHAGTAISWTDNGDYGFSADNVSDAIIELADAMLSGFGAAEDRLQGHIDEPAGAHNASQITYTLDPYVSVADVLAAFGQIARTDYTAAATWTTTSTALVAVDTANMSVTFTAPPSGTVRVSLEAQSTRAGVGVATVWGVLNDSSAVVVDNLASTYLALSTACFRTATITGLTAGASYTWRFAHRTESTGTATTAAGTASTASITIDAVP
jgi:hypothetical protein